MYIRNSSEPSTNPCGTPARIDFIEKIFEYLYCLPMSHKKTVNTYTAYYSSMRAIFMFV